MRQNVQRSAVAVIALVLGSLAGGVIDATPAGATSAIVVTDCNPSDAGSLATAITTANANPGSTITFAAGLSCPAASPIEPATTLELSSDVSISGPGASEMVVSGYNTLEVFQVDASVTAEMSGLTIENGTAAPGAPGTAGVAGSPGNGTNGGPGGTGANGGGISNAGNLSLSDVTLSSNAAGAGGMGGSGGEGVCPNPQPPDPCDIPANGGTGGSGGDGGNGGAIYSTGPLNLTGVTLEGNSAGSGGSGGLGGASVSNLTWGQGGEGGNGGSGGAIYATGTIDLMSVTLEDNTAGAAGSDGGSSVGAQGLSGASGGDGGAVYTTGGGTLTGVTLDGNAAGAGGAAGGGQPGGIGGSGGAISSSGDISLMNDTFSANSAGAGGSGPDWIGGPNTGGKGGDGGGIASSGTLSLANDTISGNSPGAGGAPGEGGGQSGTAGGSGTGGGVSNSGTGSILGTILASNATDNCAGPSLTDQGANVEDDSSCFTGPSENTTTAAIGLGVLADNGGPVETEAIGSSSAAYQLEPIASCPSTDARGLTRPQPPSSAVCDAGAFEFIDLALSMTSTPFNTPLALQAGSGTSPSFAVTDPGSAGCSLSDPTTLVSTTVGTCVVTATSEPISQATTVTVVPADQSPLSIATTTGSFPGPLTLASSGGSGTGAVSYLIGDPGSAGCSITGGVLNYSSVGACTVTATKDGGTDYNSVSSPLTMITIGPGEQSPLSIITTTGTFGSPLTLSSRGGSDGGEVIYLVDSRGTAGCSLAGATLLSTSSGTCTVTAVMLGNGDYQTISSPVTTVTIRRAKTVTSLELSRAQLTYGDEHLEVLTAIVTSAGETPVGRVKIAGTGCQVSLTKGKAVCTLANKALQVGTHQLVATYTGNTDFLSSSSASKTVVVARPGSSRHHHA